MPYREMSDGTFTATRMTNRPVRSLGCTGMGCAPGVGAATSLSPAARAALAVGAKTGDRAAKYAVQVVRSRGLGDLNLGALGQAFGQDVSGIFNTIGALTGSTPMTNPAQVVCAAQGGTWNGTSCAQAGPSTATILAVLGGIAVVGIGIAVAVSLGRSPRKANRSRRSSRRGHRAPKYFVQSNRKAA